MYDFFDNTRPVCGSSLWVTVTGVVPCQPIELVIFLHENDSNVSSLTLSNQYDLSNISQILKEKQEGGYQIIHYRKYYGQYQFIDRLTQPLIVLSDQKSVNKYEENNQKVLLITYEKQENVVDADEFLYQQPFRSI